MKPKAQETPNSDDLFRSRLDSIINMEHELVFLSLSIDWGTLDQRVAAFYAEEGRPGIPSRLIIGLHILKHMYNLSDEAVCDRWVYDPYFQFFCGETYFQHGFPIQRSSMTHFRKRVGEDFCVTLLQESLASAFRLGALETKQLKRVVVDTTVQPKAITFPTDAKLYCKAITKLAEQAKSEGIVLRQSYARVSKKMLIASSRYRHARQMKRAKRCEKKLKTWLGRIIRDVRRKALSEGIHSEALTDALVKAEKIYHQQRSDADKLYSWHAPEVGCISKGKAHKPYEFGCKASITTNVNKAPAGHFVLHAKALHGRPYDGHTLKEVIEEYESQNGVEPKRIYVDKGYRGHTYKHKARVFKSGQKRGITATIKKELKRRSVVEPVIGHLKSDGRLGRNYLYGQLGDKVNVLMVSAGYNFRLILKWLRNLFFLILYYLFARTGPIIKPLWI